MRPTKLSPCPFCGSPAVRNYDQCSGKTVYLCSSLLCGAEVVFWSAEAATREDYDRLWNSRTADSKPI